MTRTLGNTSVGDLRAVLHSGLPEATTIADALDQIADRNEASAAHELDRRAFDAYRLRREQRQGAALAEAATAADKAHRGEGDGAKMAARGQARQDAFEDFQIAEPLLTFTEWQAAGEPETHTAAVSVVKRAVAAVTERLVS